MKEIQWIKDNINYGNILHKKEAFREAYAAIYGKKPKQCPSCIQNAYAKFKYDHIMKNQEFILKEGSTINLKGSTEYYSKENMTDEIAEALLKQHPEFAIRFSKIPEWFTLKKRTPKVDNTKEEVKNDPIAEKIEAINKENYTSSGKIKLNIVLDLIKNAQSIERVKELVKGELRSTVKKAAQKRIEQLA